MATLPLSHGGAGGTIANSDGGSVSFWKTPVSHGSSTPSSSTGISQRYHVPLPFVVLSYTRCAVVKWVFSQSRRA